MKKILVMLSLTALNQMSWAQHHDPAQDTSWKKLYRETATKINNLVHTKLEVRPDFSKSWLYGKAWITLKPHFYATDSVTLDAKGMEIKKVALVKGGRQTPLKHTYNELQLRIKLDRSYRAPESYQLYIEYTAKPNEYEAKYAEGAMLGIKGMYFINPLGEEKDKPTQIWTQGETESSSAWFPTIDKPNQKTTQELTVTVASKYVTLSNGKLVSQKTNADGTRSDYWKMDLPHAPYLFFLGVGDYAVVKDTWRGKAVDYYVEKEYASVAKRIFGMTPEMMTFFSRITGVDYPWVKYAQITGRDYVAGAMENTTATLHQNYAQQDARELVDGNSWEAVIAHELFHHWFGDYVTSESWSNLTVNESFADYSETLWDEYKYGKDAGAEKNFGGLQSYLGSRNEDRDLVRFHYHDKEDMFDAVSYSKGGRILHMLRAIVGDSAFFKSINNYLTTNKFKSAEAHQLRLAFEEVTGRDMNWFFNQWYFGSGHPIVDIDYVYNDAAGEVKVILKQKQTTGKLFRLPLAIDVYESGKKQRYQVWAEHASDTFTFNYKVRPELVNVDADKIMLWAKTDNKTVDQFIAQYRLGGNWLDRREAIIAASKAQTEQKSIDFLLQAMNDKAHSLQMLAINRLALNTEQVKAAAKEPLKKLAVSAKHSLVRGTAINALGQYRDKSNVGLFTNALKDSSYTVAGFALSALSKIDEETAMKAAAELEKQPAKGMLREALGEMVAKSGNEEKFAEVLAEFKSSNLQGKFNLLQEVAMFVTALKSLEPFKQGVDAILDLKKEIPDAFKGQAEPYIDGLFAEILKAKQEKATANPGEAVWKQQADYLQEKTGTKGF